MSIVDRGYPSTRRPGGRSLDCQLRPSLRNLALGIRDSTCMDIPLWRSHCASHPSLRPIRLALSEPQLLKFAVVRISSSGGAARAPTEKFGRRWRQRTFGPRRRHIPIAQTDIISGCISDPKGVRRSGGAIWRYCNSGLAAVMQRASPRGVHPQCICTERKRQAGCPGDAPCITRITAQQWKRITRSIDDALEPAARTPTLAPLARRTTLSTFRQVTKPPAGALIGCNH